ncbi:helix-turn-helix transcriptional regulator [Modestobacter versicolor]|uniref:helix-turn-helix transcriptional regulator n=1 Tax=Modestobacter versicolor TaxID=429133 RepID=UPI0034DEFF1B
MSAAGQDGSAAVVVVGVVDARRLVRDQLGALLDADPRLRVAAVHADWAAAADDFGRTDVWVGAGGAAHVPQVSVEHLDVGRPRELCDHVLAAASGPVVPAAPPEGRADGGPPLSARERTVLESVAGGLTAAEIAVELGISTKAVENARRRAMTKLGVDTQVAAVRRLFELRGDR